MTPKIIWGNLVSADLDKTKEFYSLLGFKINGVSDDMVSIAFGDNHFIINFFKKSRLEKDFLGEAVDTQKQNEIIFSLSAANTEEVDQWYEKVINADGKALSKPERYDEGYTFVFADPDGHKYNVLYWPNM